MKRTLSIALACAMLLCGCGSAETTKTTQAAGESQAAVTVESGKAEGSSAADKTAESGQSASPQELKEMDVVLDWYPNALHAFLYDAIDKGYYEEEGLKINIRFPSNANDAISLVAAGQAEIGLYYQQDVIQARADQNVPVKSIGAVVQGPLNIILSLKEKNITSPNDLVGKTIGYAGTELSEALVRSIMEHAGADYSDVTMIDVGFDLMSSMTTGNVDATIGCLVNHEVPQMEEEGFAVNWFDLDDYGVPTYYEGIFLASDKMIENDPESLKAFLRASARGFEDMKNDPAGVLQILLSNQNAENFPLSEAVETQSMETLLPMMETDEAKFLTQTDACWQENIDWMLEQGLIDQPVSVDDVRVNLE
ncbi:MAG: ABC transporter substrate-binding protein [Brotaphodocola sp.]